MKWPWKRDRQYWLVRTFSTSGEHWYVNLFTHFVNDERFTSFYRDKELILSTTLPFLVQVLTEEEAQKKKDEEDAKRDNRSVSNP